MRIKKLIFSNINNLKGGPHHVSFEDEPLSSAGIFAITGPTGSGKSTLLDVITLALFNRIPRHGRVSRNAILDQGSVITHHAKSAYATVEYEVNGSRYTSSWSVELARTGNLKDYEMSIMDSSGNYIDINKSQVPDKNAELIGLNYDQFVKSIILSQGEFAKFLKADKNERGEMLEKLTGTDVYRKISIAAYEKYKKNQQDLKNEREVLGEMSLLSDEEMQNKEGEIKETEEVTQSLEKQIKMMLSLYQTKTQIQSLKKKISDSAKSLADVETQINHTAPDILLLEKHNEITAFSEEITLYYQAQEKLKESEHFLLTQSSIKSEAEKLLESGMREMEVFLGEKVTLENYSRVKDSFEKLVLDDDYRLQSLRTKGKDLREEINHVINNASFNFEFSQDPTQALEEISRLQVDYREKMESAEISLSDSLSALRDRYKADLSKKALLINLLDKEELYNNLSKEKSDSDLLVVKYDQSLDRNVPLLEKQKAYVHSLKEKLILLQRRREDALKIASLESLRAELKDDEPCPLCGATDHPFSKHQPTADETSMQDSIGQCKLAITQEEVGLQELEKKINQAQLGRDLAIKQASELSGKLRLLQEEINQIKRKEGIEANDLKLSVDKIEQEIQQRESGIVSFEKYRNLEDLKVLFLKLNDSIIDYKALSHQRKQKFDGDDVVKAGNAIEKKLIDSQSQIKSADEFIKDRLEQKNRAYLEIERIKKKLASELDKHGVEEVDKLAHFLLSKDRADEIASKVRRLENEKIKLKAEHDTSVKEYEITKAKDSQPELLLEELNTMLRENETKRDEMNSKLGGLRSILLQDAEKRKQLKKRQERVEMLQKEDEKWSLLNRMIGSAKGDKFANYAQGLTLKNLLAHTNRRLEGLSDRYLLNKPGSDGTLSIIDRYQGNTERSVTTLSGGEVFIISLALALSLSDMASKNIALESLFIDEGFGTLDQETLDIAMSTLEKLQSENKKMVGVISHVEALKERISTQIQLKKNSQGYSRIEVVS